ncbi:tetratricopeptide repeat protein [Treponema socranskii]|uniref:tetratricopeptide repeat protein n=1 Tax=Treponema socranskii TaxID=53419 RepID=UPI003D8A95AD
MKKSLSRPISGVFAAVLVISFISCASMPKSGQNANRVQESTESLPFPQSAPALPAETTEQQAEKRSDTAGGQTGGTESKAERVEAKEPSSPSAAEEPPAVQSEEPIDTVQKTPPVPADVVFVRELQAHLSANDTAGALASFENLPDALKGNTEIEILRASLLLSTGRTEEAKRAGEALLARDADNIDVLELNMRTALASGDNKKADAFMKRLLAFDPNNAQANIALAEQYALKHRFKLANAAYKKALQRENGNIDALFGFGQTAFYIGDIDEAKKSFEAILAKDPSHALALSYLGKIEADDSNYLRASEYIERAIAADDSNYDFYLDLGTYLRYRGKFEKAEAAWTKAIALDPSYFLAYVYRAGLYDEQKKYKEALADFNKVAETNPDYFYAYKDIGLLEWHEGNWANARAAFQKAYSYNKSDFSYVLMTAAAYLKEKNIVDCKKFLAQAMRGFDRTSLAYEMMRLYHDQGGFNAENSLRLKIDKIDKPSERGRMWYYMGLFYELKGSAKLANEYYSKIIKMQAPMFFEYRLAEWSLGK